MENLLIEELMANKLHFGCMALALAFLLIVLILLIVLLCRSKKTERLLEQRAQELESRLTQEIEKENDRMQDDIVRNLHDLHDSLANLSVQMSRSYGDQVNTILRQNSEHIRMEQEQVTALQKTVEEKLAAIRHSVDEKLTERLDKRLNESFSQVSERLEKVYTSLGEMHTLAGGVSDLKHMLGNVKTRGIWGEVQLGRLLAETMTESQYRTNVEINQGSGERVEYAVCLPGRDRADDMVYLPIDSKFPLEQYARLANASREGNAEAVSTAQKELMTAVRTEAKRIGKYIVLPYSTDFAVMFLPMESLYAEVMCHTEEVEEIRRSQHILIAGPSTLQALLSSLQMGFRTLAIEKRSAEVWRLLGAVKGDFQNYALLLQKTQEKLQQASSSVDTAFRKTRTIERRLRGVEEISGGEAERLLSDGEDTRMGGMTDENF